MPLTEPEAVRLVQKMSQELRNRQTLITRWNDYYDGDQRLVFATDAWKKAHGDRYGDFADNWCGVVADSSAERTVVSGIVLPDELKPDAELWRIWQANEGDSESSAGFVDMNVSGRVFVLVWGDPPEITWESADEVIVAYEPGSHRKRTAALKVWREDDHIEHANLYLADEVWKFERITSNTRIHVTGQDALKWRAREIETEPNPQPNPMGVVPIVELPNRPRLRGTVRSEIAGVASMQDAINLLWAYLFTTADFASFPQRVVLGQDAPKVPILDDKGQVIGEKDVPLDKFGQDRVVWLTGKQTKVDQWDAADLKQFTDIIEVQVGHVAAQTRTPPHYLATNKGLSNLSGDALVAAETGLVKKVEEQQLFTGPRIREVFRLVCLAQGDTAKAAQVAQAQVSWKDAASRSDQQMADKIIKMRQAGFPFQWILEEARISAPDVERILSMRREEMEEAARADMAAIMGGGDGQ